MIEWERDGAGVMPRVFAVNHHPEIVDRSRQMLILRQKLERGEVDQAWFEDRARVLTETYSDDARDQRLHLTSDYTLMGPVRYHLYRQVRRRAEALGHPIRAARGHGAGRLAARARRGGWRTLTVAAPSARRISHEPAAAPARRSHAGGGSLPVRAAEASPAGDVGHDPEPRGGAAHLGGRSLAEPGPGGAAPPARGVVLRGAAAVPPHPPAQPPRAHGVRHRAARPPDDPGVLLPVPGRDPGQPRAGPPHPAVRARLVAALPHREDPGAAAAAAADPGRHRGHRAAPTSPSSTPPRWSASWPCSSASP